ncbi:hypothetical protein AB0L57_19890 [Nocardia sp. NPDC052254]|uniref:hypothetical protein n=1 Tax=Nocardia sp. NPDC052254 TaxID=3155681 RepID=UPI00342A9E40
MEAHLDCNETAAVRYLAADPAVGCPEGGYGIAKRALNRRVCGVAPTTEWASAGIALNVVASGVVDTSAFEWIFADCGSAAAAPRDHHWR